jgi:hypothetical protein
VLGMNNFCAVSGLVSFKHNQRRISHEFVLFYALVHGSALVLNVWICLHALQQAA